MLRVKSFTLALSTFAFALAPLGCGDRPAPKPSPATQPASRPAPASPPAIQPADDASRLAAAIRQRFGDTAADRVLIRFSELEDERAVQLVGRVHDEKTRSELETFVRARLKGVEQIDLSGVEAAEPGRFRAGSSQVTALAFSPDGKTIAAAALWSEVAQLRDAATCDPITLLPARRLGSLAFSPDGKLLAGGTRTGEPMATLWDVATRRESRGFPGGAGPVAFSADGAALVTAGPAGGELVIWDIRESRERGRVAHDDLIPSLAISPDGKTIAWLDGRGDVRLHDAADGAERGKLSLRPESAASRRHQPVFCVAFTADGLVAAGGRASVVMWNTAGEPQRPIPIALNAVDAGSDPVEVMALAFGPDGKAFAALVAGRVWWVGVADSRVHAKFESGEAHSIALSPDGKTLAIGLRDGTVELHELPAVPAVDEP